MIDVSGGHCGSLRTGSGPVTPSTCVTYLKVTGYLPVIHVDGQRAGIFVYADPRFFDGVQDVLGALAGEVTFDNGERVRRFIY